MRFIGWLALIFTIPALVTPIDRLLRRNPFIVPVLLQPISKKETCSDKPGSLFAMQGKVWEHTLNRDSVLI